MAGIVTARRVPPAAEKRISWTGLLPWGLVALLTISNLGTLTSAPAHAAGFRALESVLEAVSPSIAERLLSRSSTRVAVREARLARKIAVRTTERLATHATRSVATIPERVAPVVGTAAVVGFVLYDVQTDCATAADMNEILKNLGQEQTDPGPICRLADQVPSPSKAWSMAKGAASGAKLKIIELTERVVGAPK